VTASVQEQFLPDGVCFGCGPASSRGLGLRSYLVDGAVVADWQPELHHVAVPGVLCGGVIGTLLDCHSGAALAQRVKDVEGRWPWAQAPGWATARYTVRMLRPTSLDHPVRLVATDVRLCGDEAVVTVEMHAAGKLRATGDATWRRLRAR
jgi:acyl-coenzyme A thioesterase PaaI-like protein